MTNCLRQPRIKTEYRQSKSSLPKVKYQFLLFDTNSLSLAKRILSALSFASRCAIVPAIWPPNDLPSRSWFEGGRSRLPSEDTHRTAKKTDAGNRGEALKLRSVAEEGRPTRRRDIEGAIPPGAEYRCNFMVLGMSSG